MPTIKYSDNPNEETAFVTQDDGQRNRVVLTAAVDGTIEYPDNPNSTKVMVTVDGVKRRAVAVANITGGGGGSDQHNLGYYATQAALEEAHPTAVAGDWAIVGATDTVWIWDTDNSEWVDSDQKGQVTSVNGRTGAVTVSEVPSMTGYSGRVLGTDGEVAGWIVPEKVQRSTMPQASEEEVGNIYQYIGVTDANYTNGYFYKCVSDGQEPATYSWTRVDVQPSPVTSVNGQTGVVNLGPSNVGAANQKTVTQNYDGYNNNGLFILSFGSSLVSTDSLSAACAEVEIDVKSSLGGRYHASVINGAKSSAAKVDIATGDLANSTIGYNDGGAILLNYNLEQGSSDRTIYSTVGLKGATVSMWSAFGFTEAQGVIYLPILEVGATLSDEFVGQILQYNGATDTNYTNGYFYKYVSDGGNPATYSWVQTNVQPAPSGLPDQTGQSGKFLTTDGTDASWSDITKVNTTATLEVADWSSNTQTITVNGVAADSVVFVSPAPASASDYASAGILCTAQAANSLTFTCTTTPSNAITVNVVCM